MIFPTISDCFMDFRWFSSISSDFLGFSWIFSDFPDFLGFRNLSIFGFLSGVFGVRTGPDGLIMILTFIYTKSQLESFILEPFRVHVYESDVCNVFHRFRA